MNGTAEASIHTLAMDAEYMRPCVRVACHPACLSTVSTGWVCSHLHGKPSSAKGCNQDAANQPRARPETKYRGRSRSNNGGQASFTVEAMHEALSAPDPSPRDVPVWEQDTDLAQQLSPGADSLLGGPNPIPGKPSRREAASPGKGQGAMGGDRSIASRREKR